MALRHRKADSAEPIAFGPAVVLVVHDDLDSCELLVRILVAAGRPVRRAHDFDQMSEVLQERPTCVVLDVSSGGIGGNLKLLDAIRHHSDPAVADVRVVLIASSSSSAMFSWQAGIDELLHRPFHADDLVAAVAEAIERPEAERKPYRRRMVEAARIGERD